MCYCVRLMSVWASDTDIGENVMGLMMLKADII